MSENIVLIGSDGELGKRLYNRLEQNWHTVFGVGLTGHDLSVAFDPDDDEEAIEGLVSHVFDKAEERFDGLGATRLIYNAGRTHIEDLAHHSVDMFREVMHINVTMAFAFIKEFHQRYLYNPTAAHKQQGWDKRVVVTSSMATKQGQRNCPAYGASKAALDQMVRCIAKEWAPAHKEAAIFGVAPCSIDNSAMMEYAELRTAEIKNIGYAGAKDYIMKNQGIGRYADVEEVWHMFYFALFNAPVAATGSIFEMSAGSGL